MKVAIFEISGPNHSVMIDNWVRICRDNSWEFKVFTTDDIYKQVAQYINIADHQLCILNKVSFFEMMKVSFMLKKYDIAIITSLQNNFLHFVLPLFINTPFFLTIHNLNTWSSRGGGGSVKNILKQFVRRLWVRKSSLFILNSENMKSNFEKNKFHSKNAIVVPFSLRQAGLSLSRKDGLHIVVPGMVSKKRKNYDYLMQLAKDFPLITFTLLGKLVFEEGGQEIESEIINNKLENVIFYKSFVKQCEFDRVMAEADFIFSVVNINYDNQGVLEVYGKTKDSGISYLMTQYAIPLIVNSEFKNFECLDSATFYFNGYSELKNSIRDLQKLKTSSSSMKESILKGRKSIGLQYVSKNVLECVNKLNIHPS